MVAFIWGTAFVAQTTGMKSMGPVTFTGFRLLLGGLFYYHLHIFILIIKV